MAKKTMTATRRTAMLGCVILTIAIGWMIAPTHPLRWITGANEWHSWFHPLSWGANPLAAAMTIAIPFSLLFCWYCWLSNRPAKLSMMCCAAVTALGAIFFVIYISGGVTEVVWYALPIFAALEATLLFRKADQLEYVE